MLSYEKIKSVDANSITYPQGSTFGPRKQSMLQLYFLHKGITTIYIDGEAVNLKAGEGILLLPDHVEYFVFSPNFDTVHSWFHFECDNLLILSPISPKDRIFVMNQTLYDIIMIELREGIVYSSDKPFHIHILASALAMVLDLIGKNRATSYENVLVSNVKNFIYKNYQSQISLDDISKALSYSQEHIIRSFKMVTNTTPIKFLWDYRKKSAIYLLENSDLSLVDVSKLCGFISYYHFCRLIKDETELTPNQIRKNRVDDTSIKTTIPK